MATFRPSPRSPAKTQHHADPQALAPRQANSSSGARTAGCRMAYPSAMAVGRLTLTSPTATRFLRLVEAPTALAEEEEEEEATQQRPHTAQTPQRQQQRTAQPTRPRMHTRERRPVAATRRATLTTPHSPPRFRRTLPVRKGAPRRQRRRTAFCFHALPPPPQRQNVVERPPLDTSRLPTHSSSSSNSTHSL